MFKTNSFIKILGITFFVLLFINVYPASAQIVEFDLCEGEIGVTISGNGSANCEWGTTTEKFYKRGRRGRSRTTNSVICLPNPLWDDGNPETLDYYFKKNSPHTCALADCNKNDGHEGPVVKSNRTNRDWYMYSCIPGDTSGITTPEPGSTIELEDLVNGNVLISWDDAGADFYTLSVVIDGVDTYNVPNPLTQTSIEIPVLEFPKPGEGIHKYAGSIHVIVNFHFEFGTTIIDPQSYALDLSSYTPQIRQPEPESTIRVEDLVNGNVLISWDDAGADFYTVSVDIDGGVDTYNVPNPLTQTSIEIPVLEFPKPGEGILKHAGFIDVSVDFHFEVGPNILDHQPYALDLSSYTPQIRQPRAPPRGSGIARPFN